MASILLDNIINQTIYNTIFRDSLALARNNIDQPIAINNSQQFTTAIVRDSSAAASAGRLLQVEREDRILTSGLNSALINNINFNNNNNHNNNNHDDQLGDTFQQQQQQNIEMSQYERIFWIFLFSIMVLVAAGGNTIVVYIVSTNKEMKSVTNYFLVNLSLADTMVSTLNVVFNFISMLIR